MPITNQRVLLSTKVTAWCGDTFTNFQIGELGICGRILNILIFHFEEYVVCEGEQLHRDLILKL